MSPAVKKPTATKKAPVATKQPAPSKEATVRAKAKARGWVLEKVGSRWRLVDAATGTRVADDWATGNGLSLDKIAAALG